MNRFEKDETGQDRGVEEKKVKKFDSCEHWRVIGISVSTFSV